METHLTRPAVAPPHLLAPRRPEPQLSSVCQTATGLWSGNGAPPTCADEPDRCSAACHGLRLVVAPAPRDVACRVLVDLARHSVADGQQRLSLGAASSSPELLAADLTHLSDEPFDIWMGLGAGATRPCQLRGAWLETYDGTRVQTLTAPIEGGVTASSEGDAASSGADVAEQPRAVGAPGSGSGAGASAGPSASAVARQRQPRSGSRRRHDLAAMCCYANWSVTREGLLSVWPPKVTVEGAAAASGGLVWLRFRYEPRAPEASTASRWWSPSLTPAAPLGPACEHCAPMQSTRAVFFNRVPKCGSSTLERIIKSQAKKKRFHFERSHDYINNSIDAREQRRVVSTVARIAQHERVLYDRHVLFVDFSKFGEAPPLYINLLRDPIKVQVSAFYFWQECICRRRSVFCRDAWQADPRSAVCTMDIDEAYRGVAPRPAVGVMTRYFCGQEPLCKAPDPLPLAMRNEALRRALYNLRHRYVWVGVLERFEESLRLLRMLLPTYFGGIYAAHASKEHVRPSNTTTYDTPLQSTLQKLALENENDAHVYRYALKRLECQLSRCGLASPHALAHAGNRTPARAEEMHRSPIGPGGSIATLANAAALRVLAVR